MTRLVLLCLFLLVASLAKATAEPPQHRVLKLDLETALQQALAKNFSIQVDRFDPKIASEGVRQELGRFDPVFDITAKRSEDNRQDVFLRGLQLQTNRVSRLDDLSSGISGVTAWGTKYDLSYGTSGQTGTRDALIAPYDASGRLALTQPLLRDAGPTVNLAQVRIARTAVKISEWQLRKRIIDVMTTTNFVYNELQASIEEMQVAERSRELARQLLKDNQARVEIGVKSPLDVTEARAEVAAREEGVILARRTVLDNENLLKQLVTRDMLTMLDTRVEIAPPPSPRFSADVRGGVADALALRPDYRQALLDLDQRHIRVALQKNHLLPRIDLTGSLELLGIENDFGGAASRIAQRDRTSWTAGVIFSIPLGNREARGALNQANLEAAKALVAIEQLEQQIIVDVDNASGQIVTSRQRITSTREARRLARESLDAGEERLRAGTGTTFVVLELQKKLAESELAELRAVADYNKAVSEYQRQTGTTLREHHVVME
ncbi:MAG: TolC family protein [Chthoniobacteraceae bacterium]